MTMYSRRAQVGCYSRTLRGRPGGTEPHWNAQLGVLAFGIEIVIHVICRSLQVVALDIMHAGLP